MAPAPPLTVLQLTGDGLDERDGCVGWQGQGTQVLEDRAEAAQVGLALQEEITRLALNVDDVAGSRFAEAEDDERAGHARVTAYVVRQGLHGDLREAGSLGQAVELGFHDFPAAHWPVQRCLVRDGPQPDVSPAASIPGLRQTFLSR